MNARVALATCAELPQLGEDEPLLLQALRDRGISAEPAVWDDGDVDWGAFELVVVRSTWDYAPRRDQFVAWARSLPRVLNPGEVIAWNTDKRYLGELPSAVPTTYVAPAEGWDAALVRTRGRGLVRTTCPRDCYDACGVVVQLEDGVIRKAAGTRRTQ